MVKVSTDSISPAGSVIATDVISSSGSTLLQRGASITPALGRRLRNWGIAYVYIEGQGGSGQTAKTAVRAAIDIKSELYDIFYGTLDNARMKKIFDAVCKHKLQQHCGE